MMRCGQAGACPEEGNEDDRGSGNKALWGESERTGHVSLEKRRLWGDMIALFKYLKGCHTEEGQDFFSILPEGRIRNNGLKLQEASFHLDIRKTFLTVRAVQQWNQLPRELEAFKRQLDSHLSGML